MSKTTKKSQVIAVDATAKGKKVAHPVLKQITRTTRKTKVALQRLGAEADGVLNKEFEGLHALKVPYATGRETLKTTISAETMTLLRSVITFQRGGQGASFVEFALKLAVALVQGDDKQAVALAKSLNTLLPKYLLIRLFYQAHNFADALDLD